MSSSIGVTCSGEDGNYVFGECWQRHDYSLLPVPGGGGIFPVPGSTARLRLLPGVGAKRMNTVFTATLLHGIERDDYTNKAPCRFRVLSALPQGMPILLSKLLSL